MDIKELFTKYYFRILAIITLPIVLYSYLKIIFFNDIYTFFGSAILADGFGGFPANIDIAWETRPIGNRLIFYTLYKVCSGWYGNDIAFRIATKLAVAVLILIVSWYFAVQLHKYLTTVNKSAIFLITVLSLLTLHLILLLETEFFAATLAFLAIALLLSNNKYANIISGIVMVFIILLKIITIIFIPMIIIAWLLISQEFNKSKLYLGIIGIIGATAAFAVMCVVWFKHFIPDTLLMILLHNRASEPILTRVFQLLTYSIGMWWFIPVLIIGVTSGVIIFYDLFKSNNIKYASLFILMWLCTPIAVIIQAEWTTVYHYTGLVIPSVISILLFLYTHYRTKQEFIFTGIIIIIMCTFIMTCSVWTNTNEHYWDYKLTDAILMETQFKLSDQPSMLYLDVGISSYFIGVPDACRETYPLIIVRGYTSGLENEPSYQSAKSCLLKYKGDYFIYDGSIKDPEIATKINNEYIKVYNGSYNGINYPASNLYQRKGVV